MPETLQELGRPDIQVDDNDLKTITRRFKVQGKFTEASQLPTDVLAAWGVEDTEFTGCYLVDQRIEGLQGPNDNTSRLMRVYREANGTPTLINNVRQELSFEGRILWHVPYIILTANLGDAGIIPAMGSITYNGAVLYNMSIDRGKVVSLFTRSFVDLTNGQFLLSNSERKNADGVVLKTETFLMDQDQVLLGIGDDTVNGTIIDRQISQDQGLQHVTYTYADLTDPVIFDVQTSTRNNGKLIITRIRAVGVTGGDAPDWASYYPSGSVLIDEGTRDDQAQGLTYYDRTYVKGVGVISERETFRSESSFEKVITEIQASGDAAPDYTDTDQAVLNQTYREEDGYKVWTTTVFYLGATTYQLSLTEEETGNSSLVRRQVILAKNGETPHAIGDTVGGLGWVVDVDVEKSEGPQKFTYTFTDIGETTIYDYSTSLRNNNLLGIKRYRAVGIHGGDTPDWAEEVPSGYALIDESEQSARGLTFYERTYASGVGVISTQTSEEEETSQQITYTEITAPGASAPDYTGSNKVILSQTEREEDGYQIWTTVVLDLKADRVDLNHQQDRNRDGSERHTYTWKGTNATNPYTTPAGAYRVAVDVREITDSYKQFSESWIVPPGDKTIANGKAILRTVNFQFPGLCSVASGALELIPPTTRRLVARVEITHSETKATEIPWSVVQWATFNLNYTESSTGEHVWRSEGLRGYLGNSSWAGSSDWAGVDVSAGAAVTVSSPGTLPAGETIIDVQSEPYLEATDGTIVYRNVITKVDLPTDYLAPDAPANLVVTAGSGQNGLNWDDNSETDLHSTEPYWIYRKADGEPLYSKIAASATSDYTDTDVEVGTEYFYVVTARDTSLNESVYSAEDSGIPT